MPGIIDVSSSDDEPWCPADYIPDVEMAPPCFTAVEATASEQFRCTASELEAIRKLASPSTPPTSVYASMAPITPREFVNTDVGYCWHCNTYTPWLCRYNHMRRCRASSEGPFMPYQGPLPFRTWAHLLHPPPALVDAEYVRHGQRSRQPQRAHVQS